MGNGGQHCEFAGKVFASKITGFLGQRPKPCPRKWGGLEGRNLRASDFELVSPLQKKTEGQGTTLEKTPVSSYAAKALRG